MQAEGDPWCPKLYPLHEPVRARPLPVRPHPHLPQGRDVGDLHDETVLLAPLKPAGIARTRRFFSFFPCCFTAPLRLRPAAPATPTASNQKFMSFIYWTRASPALQSPATVLLARHLSADLTGIPPSLENTAHLELLQAACSIHCHSVCNQNNRDSQSGFCTSWHLPTCLSSACSS